MKIVEVPNTDLLGGEKVHCPRCGAQHNRLDPAYQIKHGESTSGRWCATCIDELRSKLPEPENGHHALADERPLHDLHKDPRVALVKLLEPIGWHPFSKEKI